MLDENLFVSVHRDVTSRTLAQTRDAKCREDPRCELRLLACGRDELEKMRTAIA